MNKQVSLREYARMRGVRLNAVQTAVNSGRIHKTANGKIDVEQANKEWFMNTDPAKSRKTDPLFEATGNEKSSFSTFQQAKTADIYYRAMLAKAKLKMVTNETIDRKQAGLQAFTLGRQLRDLFSGFATRYGALIAAELETDEHKTVMVLDEYVRKLLSESRELIEREA
jgi:hypothetical protein